MLNNDVTIRETSTLYGNERIPNGDATHMNRQCIYFQHGPTVMKQFLRVMEFQMKQPVCVQHVGTQWMVGGTKLKNFIPFGSYQFPSR